MRTLLLVTTVLTCVVTGPAVLAQDEHPATIDLRVDDQPLLTLLERIARQCDRGLVIHRGLDDLVTNDVSIYAKNAPWDDALQFLLSEYGLELILTPKRLEVRSATDAFAKRLVKRQYPIEALVASAQHYPARRLGCWQDYEEGSGGSLIILDEEQSSPLLEDLVSIIQASLVGLEESWEREGVQIRESEDRLSVRHLPEAQERVESLLATLEKNGARQVSCRVHEFRRQPTDAPIVTASQYASLLERAKLVSAFVTADGKRNHHYAGVESQIVHDVEMVHQIADPVVFMVREGLVIDIHPHITRSGILTNASLQRCQLNSSTTIRIGTVESPLTDIDAINLSEDDVNDSRLIPPGGAAIYKCGNRWYGLQLEVQ